MTRLQEARQAAGLSMRQLAASTGLSPSQISRWESGNRPLRQAQAATVYDLAQRLGVTVEWLLGAETQNN